MKQLVFFFLVSLMTYGCVGTSPKLTKIPASDLETAKSIDIRGKTITTFILYRVSEELKPLGEGDRLAVTTDSFPAFESDFRSWSRMTGHELVKVEKQPSYERYYIEKRPPGKRPKSVAIVLSEAGLEETLSPLGFALGVALSGGEVHIYLQGPAVRILKKGFQASLTGFSAIFSSFARKGMADSGHIAPQDKLRQLRQYGAKLYLCGPSMEHFGVKADELIFDDVVFAEYFTFVEVMNRTDIHLYP